ncbi:MAG: hypothetical protein ACU826_05775 [Gammaproteobacteria bacterium]
MKVIFKAAAVILLTLSASTALAKGMNKCIIDGRTVYTHKNCPSKESRAYFEGGTFNAMNISVNASRYSALNKRASELAAKGYYLEAGRTRKIADLAAKDINYKVNSKGTVQSLNNANYLKSAEPRQFDRKLSEINVVKEKRVDAWGN